MRYIRTKDGIFENKPIEKHLGKRKGNGFEIVFKEQDIIKQADTIEELCDETIIVAPYRFKRPRTGRELDKDFDEMVTFYMDKEDTIYGAIWIIRDSGEPILKSVAKVNEKGELQLL